MTTDCRHEKVYLSSIKDRNTIPYLQWMNTIILKTIFIVPPP